MDSGTTGNFLHVDAPCKNKQPTLHPITVELPNGSTIQSTHTAELTIEGIPHQASTADILPGLHRHSLLSVAKLCDAGCNVVFDQHHVKVYNAEQRLVLTGQRSSNGLWEVALPKARPTLHRANMTVYTAPTKQAIMFQHRSLFAPTKSTLLSALDNNHFIGWPAFNKGNVRKYLTKTEPTVMGHMDRQRQNTRSTKKRTEQSIKENDDDMQQAPGAAILDGKRTHDVVMTVIDNPTGQIYTDQTGAFPVVSARGVKYLMVLYDYDSNVILAEGLSSRGQGELLRGYKELLGSLKRAGLQPRIQRLDNEASGQFKRFLDAQGIDYQLTPTSQHRRNAAERAIRTWKNHFIAGLATLNPSFPLAQWDLLIPQTNITLNLLRPSRLNPKLSAYAQLFGNFDFNRTPLAPPGCAVIAFNDPTIRTTFGAHGTKGYYVGPALEHYRCYKVWIPSSRRIRIIDTIEFFPHDFAMPALSSADAATRAAHDLTQALRKPHPAGPLQPVSTELHSQLQQLADIFQKQISQADAAAPRVASKAAANHVAPDLRVAPTVEAIRADISAMTQVNDVPPPLLQSANGVFDVDTGKTLQYRQLLKDPRYKPIWTKSAANEFGRLMKGIRDIKGTETMEAIYKHEIPAGRTCTYGRFVCEERPQKAEVARTRLTLGGNLIDYPGNKSAPTANITTYKIHCNDVISTPNARCVDADLGNFYLNSPMDRPEFVRILLVDIPDEIIDEYNLREKADDKGAVYFQVNKGMYGLPQAGILAFELLKKRLAQYGYHPTKHTHGLWKHESSDLSFVLVVDDFSIKYTDRAQAERLFTILRQWYPVKIDWDAALFCGITTTWDYEKRTVTLSMPGYVDCILEEYQRRPARTPQHAPYRHNPVNYGARVQYAPKADTTARLPPDGITRIQKIVGKSMYYGRAVDSTIGPALSAISSDQSKATELTDSDSDRLLDYLQTHPDAQITYHASDMQLIVHSDASFANEPRARSRIGGHHYLGNRAGRPQIRNGAILNPTYVLKHVCDSAADSEIGGTYINCKEALPSRLALEEMGWKQDATRVVLDNSTAYGFATNTIKQKRTRTMDIRYHWLRDREAQQQFVFEWQPGDKNLGDYFTKHHPPAHHIKVRPHYINEAHLTSSNTRKQYKPQQQHVHCEGVLIPRRGSCPVDGQTVTVGIANYLTASLTAVSLKTQTIVSKALTRELILY